MIMIIIQYPKGVLTGREKKNQKKKHEEPSLNQKKPRTHSCCFWSRIHCLSRSIAARILLSRRQFFDFSNGGEAAIINTSDVTQGRQASTTRGTVLKSHCTALVGCPSLYASLRPIFPPPIADVGAGRWTRTSRLVLLDALLRSWLF